MNTMHHSKSRLSFWNDVLREAMLAEGKHWPEDYIKAAINKLKAAGKYNREKTDADVKVIAQRFKPKFHTNSALGYFNSVVRWYSEDPDNFIKPKNADGTQSEDKLERALAYLKQFLNTQDLVQKDGEKVKSQISLEDFQSMMKKISDEDAKNAASIKFKVEDKGYKIIPFMSYEDLHQKFGGNATGYDGESEWCHTNGQSTYESWTADYTRFFFVIAKDGWEKIKPHDNPRKDDNAYDEYGLSLMAILVSKEGKLLKCTLRWNHVIEPKYTKPGREVDGAFISFAELSQVTGLDVEAEVKRQLAEVLEKIRKIPKGKKVYEGPEGLCFARDHFYWYDKDFNPISTPDKIRGGIECYRTDITSLEGSPRVVEGDFSCSFRNITSLVGAPQIVNGLFDCSHTKITSLKDSPTEVKNYFDCSYTNITSLEGCPKKVGGSFYCRRTKITSLEGIPRTIHGTVDCSYTKMTSLEGSPESVMDLFKFGSTDLTSLEGAPKNVGYRLIGVGCDNLESLKGAPAKVKNNDVSFFDTNLDEILEQQVDDYKKWLDTNPKENYPG